MITETGTNGTQETAASVLPLWLDEPAGTPYSPAHSANRPMPSVIISTEMPE